MNWNKTIFLAHASEDKEYVRFLYKELKSKGLEPWLDEVNLMPGEKWDNKIKEAIKKSRFFVACLSSRSISKNGYVQKELKVALSELEQKSANVVYFIPALIEDVVLPEITVGTIDLTDYQAIKLYENDGINKLISYLAKEVSVFEELKTEKNPDYEKIRIQLSNGELESGLDSLIEDTKNKNSDWYNSILLISARFNKLKKDSVLGILPQEQMSTEMNRIVYSLLEIISSLERRKKHLI